MSDVSGSPRAVPFYCPYCGDEELEPAGEKRGGYHCPTCTRTFSLRLETIGARAREQLK